MTTKIQERLMDFLAHQYQITEDEIVIEDNLVDQGVIDSFGFVEIATFLEEEFSITVSDEEITAENFGTIVNIVHLVENHMSE